jgi:hypothetical protein
MRLGWKLAAVAVIGGVWAAPASAFGKKHACGGTTSGTTAFTTVSGPMTLTTTRMSVTSFPAITTGGVMLSPNVLTFSQPGVNFGGFSSFGGFSGFGLGGASGDLGTLNQSIQTLNQSIQTLNTTLAATNAQLTKLVGPPGGDGAVGDGNVPIPRIPDDPLGQGLSGTVTGTAPRLPYHLYAERQIEQALAAKDGARAAYYYHKNVEITEQRIKEMNDTRKRIDEKIKAAKQAGVAIPGVP